MNFFGLGPGEIALIAVLALVVVGPAQLPALLKQLGGWVSKAQEMQRDLRRGMDDIVRDTELEGVTKTISSVRNFTPAGAASSFLESAIEAAGKPDSDSVSSKSKDVTADMTDVPTVTASKEETGQAQTSMKTGSAQNVSQASSKKNQEKVEIMDPGAEEVGDS